MSEFERLKFVVQELDYLVGRYNVSPVKPFRVLKDNIINFLRMNNIEYGLDFPKIEDKECNKITAWHKYLYNCSDCGDEIYRVETKMYFPICNKCNLIRHNEKRIELFS